MPRRGSAEPPAAVRVNRCRVPRAGLRMGDDMSHIKQIQDIRERARKQITEGAVTEDYKLDRKQVISILNEALATEIVCVLRYKFHYFMASGIHSQSVKDEFKEH